MLHGVAAQFHIGSACTDVETGVSHLHGSLLVLDRLLQQLDVLLHVEDLLQNLHAQKQTRQHHKNWHAVEIHPEL